MQTIQPQMTSRLDACKYLRDIFNAQNSKALKKAFDALGSSITISEEELEVAFNRYFVGPMEPIADPFASVYLDKDEFGNMAKKINTNIEIVRENLKKDLHIIEGATNAASFLLFKSLNTSKICLLSIIAPKGQMEMHFPQLIHRLWSIFALPLSSFFIAFTGQTSSQGTTIFNMAL